MSEPRRPEPGAVKGPKKLVVTGGPGAGKTAVLELMRRTLCPHVRVVRESASLVFGGGFPREAALPARLAAQRAIFYVQRELEVVASSDGVTALLCDRGTVDGAAYVPDSQELWSTLGTSLDEQLARYDVVIHLRTPSAEHGYNHDNPLRVESALEAAALDARIAAAWSGHPRRYEVPANGDFLAKAAKAIEILRSELPGCCAPAKLGAATGLPLRDESRPS